MSSRTPAALIVIAMLAVAGRADAFCPSKACKGDACQYEDPKEEICAAVGEPLHWTRCVSYSLDATKLPPAEVTARLAVIDSAFRAWYEITCPDENKRPWIQVQHAGEVLCDHIEYNASQGNANTVVFRKEWPHDQRQLALTTSTYNPKTGELYDADMEINLSDEAAFLFSTDPTTPDSADLQTVITHEAGHFLGFGHVHPPRKGVRPNSVMIPDYEPDFFPDLRKIGTDDVDAICSTYPPDGAQQAIDCAPRNGFSPECALNPNIGGWCAADANRLPRHGAESALVASALLAAIGWRRRRRCRVRPFF